MIEERGVFWSVQDLVEELEPIHLEEVNDEVNAECKTPILWSYRIPAGDKLEIKKQLERLGIHEGTLYPEMEQQAAYLKRVWLVAGKPPSGAGSA
ncbi:MAG: hypothetical protein WAM82_19420 [Thermoanaerobaculia bacterium]